MTERVIVFAVLLGSGSVYAADAVTIKWSEASRKLCHEISFADRWPTELGLKMSINRYEVRSENNSSTMFLIGAEFPTGTYSPKKYRVDFADNRAKPIPVSEETWMQAKKISFYRKTIPESTDSATKPAEYQGRIYAKRGKEWGYTGALLSPNGTHIVLQSFSGPVQGDPALRENVRKPRARGNIFLDAYDTASGLRLLLVDGTYEGWALDHMGHSGWVTERFFVLPLEEYFTAALVCDFGR